MRVGDSYDLQARMAARAARAAGAAERARDNTVSGDNARPKDVAQKGDQVDLPARANVLLNVKRSLERADPVRSDVVSSLKADIASGRYEPDAGRTARGLVDVLSGRQI